MTRQETKRRRNYIVPCIVLSALYSVGAHYYYGEAELSFAIAIALFLARTAVCSVAGMIFYYCLERLFNSGLIWDKSLEIQEKKQSAYLACFLLFWAPVLLIKYPGAMCWDTWQMLYQYRSHSITTHHSVFYTVVLGKLIDITESQGNANIGLFVFVLLHYIVLAFVFSYSLALLQRLKVRKQVIVLVMIIWLLNPCIIGYIGVAMKDVLYAAFMVLITTMIIEICIDQNVFFSCNIKQILLFSAVVISCLTRKNGIYVASFIFIVAVVKAYRKEMNIKLAVILIAGIIASVGINAGLNNHYNAAPSSVSEALSVPFQQTARYLKYHGDDVTESEKAAIERVLDYDNIAYLYNPQKSDSVKGTYKGDNRCLPAYFKTWFAQFLKHPLCYCSAYAEQYYYVFVPESDVDNIVLYKDTNIGYETSKIINIKESTPFYEELFSSPKWLDAYKEWIIRVFRGLNFNFLIGMIANLSLNTYLMLFLLGKLICDKKPWLVAFSASIVALGFALLGPAVYGHPRYLFPIIWSMPILLIYTMNQYGTDKDDSRTIH